MALKKVKGNLERMFDKNLTDLVRGIRNNKDNEAKYIAQCIDEIKQELRQDNLAVKATAVAKLTYLQMLGYDMSWAGFNVIEVMSSSKFTYKRIGYLASSQSFHADTELLMLTTNMVRKDLNSQNQYDAGLALSALSCFISTDLARDLANDIMTLLTSTKPYLRKKAVLMMYKVFLRYPEALRPAFPRLKDKLEDPDSGVQSAAVNVVCELARKNPKNYLSLAPVFFKLMTTSTNNWMLIKIIKLFGALTPLEPRLGKKLIEPLTNLIHSTSAMSLLYECINTVIAVLISISSGMPNHSASIQLCVQKLRILIEDSDQNLKYLGLLAMSKILKTHPKSVQSHKDLVMQCLDDKDESIRLRALDLLYGMVSKKTLMEIVKKLMIHMDKAEGTTYRDELLSKIIDICSQNNYQYITNFEWYVSVLVELTRMEGTQHGKLVAAQMVDVAVRVQAVRAFTVTQMALLLENSHLLAQPPAKMADVLYAAAWICGEFASELPNTKSTLEALLNGRINCLPPHIQAIYVHNILKVFSKILEVSGTEEAIKICRLVMEKLPLFVGSGDLEVQERACSALELVKLVEERLSSNDGDESIIQAVSILFAGEMNPVAPKAQRKVQIPEGLDLEAWINDPPSSSSEEEFDDSHNQLPDIFTVSNTNDKKAVPDPTPEELTKMREARRHEQEMNPNYLKSTKTNLAKNIEVTPIDLSVPLIIPGLASSEKYIKKGSTKERTKKKKKKGKKDNGKSDESSGGEREVEVYIGRGEMPDGAVDSGDENPGLREADDPHAALDINLDEPLKEEEKRIPLPDNKLPPKTNKHKRIKKDKEKTKSNNVISFKENGDDLHNDYCGVISSKSEDKKKKKKKSLSSNKVNKTEDRSHKSSKHNKKSKKAPDNEGGTLGDLVNIKDGYEEALGISTPSKESHVPINQPSLTRLANNKTINLDYHVRHVGGMENEVITYLVITNNSQDIVRNVEINVSDSNNIQLINELGSVEVRRKLGLVLSPGGSGETALTLRISEIAPKNRLRATVSYLQQNTNGEQVENKLDVWLTIPLPIFLTSDSPPSEIVTTQLQHSATLTFSPIAPPYSFQQRLKQVCRETGLGIIETVDDRAATLWARTVGSGGNQVCLLIKSDSKRLSLEGKSDSAGLLSATIAATSTALS
ncbi:AP-3 complex subunit delta-1 [Halyomorpha halys]|uniref:AP-3 complex subunit delta-1 n=1 Tax=Halyomorpha halys TaxID=286706 RepID=UPI0006D50901|nr:AP-3 complex subunit delta-1 [Halyomorpha halys]